MYPVVYKGSPALAPANCHVWYWKSSGHPDVTDVCLSLLPRVTAEVKHNASSTVVCRVQGEWNSVLEFTYSSGETKCVDLSKLAVTRKRVRPLDKQDPFESRCMACGLGGAAYSLPSGPSGSMTTDRLVTHLLLPEGRPQLAPCCPGGSATQWSSGIIN